MPDAIPENLSAYFRSGQVPANQVGSALDGIVAYSTNQAVQSGRIPPQYAQAYADRMRQSLQAHAGKFEDMAYRASGLGASLPTNYSNTAANAVSNIGMTYLPFKGIEIASKWTANKDLAGQAQHLSLTGMTPAAINRTWKRLRSSAAPSVDDKHVVEAVRSRFNPNRYTPERARAIVDRAYKMKNPGMSLGRAAKLVLRPHLPSMILGEMIGLTRPLSDPKYQRGERGYLSSLWEGRKGEADTFGAKMQDISKNYGIAGVPLQLFHGMTNPISGLMYGAGAVKDYFTGDNAAENVRRADEAIARSFGENH